MKAIEWRITRKNEIVANSHFKIQKKIMESFQSNCRFPIRVFSSFLKSPVKDFEIKFMFESSVKENKHGKREKFQFQTFLLWPFPQFRQFVGESDFQSTETEKKRKTVPKELEQIAVTVCGFV